MKRLATLLGRQQWVRLLRRRPWKRLESNIAAYEKELEGRDKLGGSLATILNRAKAALQDGNIDEGWKCLQAAQRVELFGLDMVELEAAATTIRNEAEKLSSWRKNAVIDLLTAEDGENQKPARVFSATQLLHEHGGNRKPAKVFRAAKLLHEHYDNEAYKDSLRRSSSLWFAVVLVIVLLALLLEAHAGILLEMTRNRVDADGANLFKALLSVGLMGLLGATIFAITDAPRLQSSARIPEMTSTIRVITLRLLMGPSSAIVIYFLIRSNLYANVFKEPSPDGYAILTIAFVAGFTERLVLRVIETVAGKPSA